MADVPNDDEVQRMRNAEPKSARERGQDAYEKVKKAKRQLNLAGVLDAGYPDWIRELLERNAGHTPAHLRLHNQFLKWYEFGADCAKEFGIEIALASFKATDEELQMFRNSPFLRTHARGARNSHLNQHSPLAGDSTDSTEGPAS